MNNGHGHVFPRDDGAKARCGGPRVCSVCAREAATKDAILTGNGFLRVDANGHLYQLDPEIVLIRSDKL